MHLVEVTITIMAGITLLLISFAIARANGGRRMPPSELERRIHAGQEKLKTK